MATGLRCSGGLTAADQEDQPFYFTEASLRVKQQLALHRQQTRRASLDWTAEGGRPHKN
jgi:hypothetical protein